jgi:outer membrane protein assembly factor BamB
MRMHTFRLGALAAAGLWMLWTLPASSQSSKQANWPSFRGLNAGGVAEGFPTAASWNVEKSENVLWKTPIPGLAHSSPIIWGDRLFVTTAISGLEKPELKVGLYGSGDSAKDDTSHVWKVFCLDKRTGKVLWERDAAKGVPKLKRHTKATQANSTMATDGKRLVAFFGSEGLYCYDMSGKLLWKKDLGHLQVGPYDAPTLEWGYASSPILHDNRVIVECDVLNGSFLAALDANDGHEVWRTPRDENATWSTPTVYQQDGRKRLAVNGYKCIAGYDFQTGKEVWRMKGGGDIPVPTPVLGHGMIYITNAHGRMAPVYAVKEDAQGDISLQGEETANAGISWSTPREGSYMQTPLVYGDYLYVCRINGILNCYEAKTGKRLYQERLGTGRTGFSSSPVGADGKVYVASEDGDVYVIQAGPEFKLLATNPMGEICMATPAISEGVLYFRTPANVVAIKETRKAVR